MGEQVKVVKSKASEAGAEVLHFSYGKIGNVLKPAKVAAEVLHFSYGKDWQCAKASEAGDIQ